MVRSKDFLAGMLAAFCVAVALFAMIRARLGKKALIEIKEAGNCLAQDVELKVTKIKGEMKNGKKNWKSNDNDSSVFNEYGFDG